MPNVDLPLRDIHLPEAISWWPPAIGWWLLALMIPALIGGAYWLYKIFTRKTAVKTARKTLAAIKQDTSLDNLTKLGKISILIRRVAISLAPRSEAAGLTGRDWLIYLDATLKDNSFSEGAGRYLMDSPYRREQPDTADMDRLIDLCEKWLYARTKK